MIEFERCRIRHLHEIAWRLRAEEQAEIAATKLKTRHVMLSLYRQTIEPWAAVCHDGVVAVWGDAAPVLAREGSLWLFTSPLIEKMPLTFAREARRWIGRYLESRETLVSGIGVGCGRAVRFYGMLGFVIHEPVGGFHEISIGRA